MESVSSGEIVEDDNSRPFVGFRRFGDLIIDRKNAKYLQFRQNAVQPLTSDLENRAY